MTRLLCRWFLAAAMLFAGAGAPLLAGLRETAQAVVGLRVEVPGDARTADTLGRERRGSGVVIDGSGLVLTIGYLVIEASGVEILDATGRPKQAEVVAYDGDTGLALVRSLSPLEVAPAPLGSAAGLKAGEPLLALSRTGGLDARPVMLADRRSFAGYWEYALDEALFTAPPHPEFGGAPLVDRDGKVVGVGSLRVADSAGPGIDSPGNMFVPVDLLQPIMADLLAYGKRDGPASPWLGVSATMTPLGVMVTRVTDDGPAAHAGLRQGDLVTGVGGKPVRSLAELWKAIRGQGPAGVVVPLEIVRRPAGPARIEVTSMDRSRWLRWRSSL